MRVLATIAIAAAGIAIPAAAHPAPSPADRRPDSKAQQAPEAPPAQQSMADAIAHADRMLFDAVFRTCDLDALADLLTEDFEFYHDKWGFTANSRQAFVESIRNLCERQKQGLDFRARREIVPGSVTVYPIGEYGAVQTGVHRFYKVVEGQSDTPTEVAKFTHLWKKDGDRWRLARVFSYDHQPADLAPRPQAAQGSAASHESTPAPDSAAAPETSEFEIVATILQIDGDIPGGLPLLAVHYDPLFEVLLRVDRVVAGISPFRAGERFVLSIHSPAMTYAGRPADGSRHLYRFRATRGASEVTYALLEVRPSAS